MQTLMNHVQLIGRLGDDLELKDTSNGSKMTRINLATNEVYYKEDGSKMENTYWHTLIAWGKTAEHMQSFCKKGSQVAIQGKLTNRSYEKEGNKQFITEVQVSEFLLLDKKQ